VFSTKAASWIALVAVACFLLLIAFLLAEFMHYRAAPSVWPSP